ncbi:MAG: HEAT repeat domain-containing protein [Planctomycetota bacterium]
MICSFSNISRRQRGGVASRFVAAAVVVIAVGWAITLRAQADAPETIAGRTIQQYASQLDSPNRVVRLRALKSLGAFGADAGNTISTALGHSDAAMRYTAAVHLGRLGSESAGSAKDALTKLAADDPSAAVRSAAAFALCRLSPESRNVYLPQLIERLKLDQRGAVCSVAELLGMLGKDATDAVETLTEVHLANLPGGKGDYHIGGATKNALRKIVPDWDKQASVAK